jgi:DNA-binding response OmpR family regulator
MGEAKLRFFMNMSHEIRTPMTLIITPLLSLLKNDDDPARRNVYETIKRNAERILSLINQMMDLRKIDKGQMQMRMSETDLVGFVKDIYDLFENQAKAKQITLTYEHDIDRLPVWIDRKNFDKVVMNVLSNAFKYTPTGGEVGIRLFHDDQQATIAIRDNGEKIPEDKLDKIFERFYQTASTANDRNVGTGIGLDLTRSLVELHHGTISAHNLVKGCEFVISIPMGNAHLTSDEMVDAPDVETTAEELLPMEEEVAAIEEAAPQVEVPQNRRQVIVIAEDDDEIRSYLEKEFEKDYDVRTCSNGMEALGEVLRTIPDLVISDVMMPEMDGHALCSKIKTNPSVNFVPVVMLTAKSRDEDKLEGLETGADAYIVKPFNMDILRRTVHNLIGSRRLLRLKYERNDDLEEQVDDVRLKSPDEKLLDRVMECINKNLSNSDLSVDMIAEKAGISRVHLHRKMKELTGQTPHDFIRNIRLKKAAQLLTTQGMNVTEVMYACGFSNSASFSTVFKKYYGMSPRDYMREHEERQ